MTGGQDQQDGAGPRPARPVALPAQPTAVPRPGVPAPGGVATAAPPDGTGAPAAAPGSKRAHPWKAAFFVLAVVAIIAGVTWALLGSKFLVVRSITVKIGRAHV